jgi:hypothetical protein
MAWSRSSKSKYGARKTVLDGIEFHSAGESRRYADLKLRERAGDISGLTLQPVFPIIIGGAPLRIRSTRGIGSPIKVILDFAYFEGQERVVEDFKGFDTPISRLKRALVEHIYHVRVKVTGKAS